MKKSQIRPGSAEEFYAFVLKTLTDHKIKFLMGGTYALSLHTGIERKTKDLDIFCKASDYPEILSLFRDLGYKTDVDERWLAKIYKGKHFVDFIFSTINNLCPVDDTWFENAPKEKLFGTEVLVMRAEEMIWSKSFRQERHKYDGPDVNHILLKKGKDMDWKRLMIRMEPFWELLFAHLLNFRFVYPGYRNIVPKWVLEELMKRVNGQMSLPVPSVKNVCRGRLISPNYYEVDYKEWGFVDSNYLI